MFYIDAARYMIYLQLAYRHSNVFLPKGPSV